MPQFNPYTDNGGTIAAIAGKGFAIMAADTRLVSGFLIYTREQKRIIKLTDNTIFGSAGCWCDSLTFCKALGTRLKYYQYENNKPMSTVAIGQVVSNMLYGKRFFPYYVNNIVAGITKDGQGVVYSYDPVGSYETLNYGCSGSSASMITPILDCLIKKEHQTIVDDADRILTKEKAVSILKDSFFAASERDISTGDAVQIVSVTSDGTEEEIYQLRKD